MSQCPAEYVLRILPGLPTDEEFKAKFVAKEIYKVRTGIISLNRWKTKTIKSQSV